MGDPDLIRGQPPRGLVVLPAVGDEPQLAPSQPSPVRRWSVLLATLAVGAVVIVLIALLWSSGSAGPDPRSLPPPSSGSR